MAAFAADVKRPEPLRVEAVSILGVWAAPSPLDRVDGFYLTPFAGAAGVDDAARQRRGAGRGRADAGVDAGRRRPRR